MASACVNLHIMPQNCATQNYSSMNYQNNNHNLLHLSTMSGKTPIAPAPPSQSMNRNLPNGTNSVLGINGVNVRSSESSKYKKKYTYANMPYGEQPASVARRNARERNRVKQVNNGFANLRQHIPQTIITALSNGGRGASKKLSKVDTLRLAVEYIRRLQDLIDESDSDAVSTSTMNSQDSSISSPMQNAYYPAGSPEHFSVPTPCSETSSSPTPSYNSDISIGNNNYIQSPGQYKFEHYENYNTMRSEDEELLDYISSWQDQ